MNPIIELALTILAGAFLVFCVLVVYAFISYHISESYWWRNLSWKVRSWRHRRWIEKQHKLGNHLGELVQQSRFRSEKDRAMIVRYKCRAEICGYVHDVRYTDELLSTAREVPEIPFRLS